jgi:hypothetical protein
MHRTLTESGLPDRQADASIRVIQGGVATKHDLDETRAELKHDIEAVRTDLKYDIGGVRTEIRHEIAQLRTELTGRIERLDNKVNLILGGVVLAVLAPAIARLIVG